MEITNTREASELHGLKILVFGPPGSGKTRLAATTGVRDRTLILSAEAGLLSLRDFEIDVVEIDSLSTLQEAFLYIAGPKDEETGEREPEHDYEWIVLDSISEIGEVVLHEELGKTKDPRKAYGEMANRMFALIKRFRDLHFNVYFTAKIDRQKDGEGNMLFMPDLPGRQLGPGIPYLFDEVFALRAARGEDGDIRRYLQTANDGYYDCKDRSGALEETEPPNLARIAKKIRARTEEDE